MGPRCRLVQRPAPQYQRTAAEQVAPPLPAGEERRAAQAPRPALARPPAQLDLLHLPEMVLSSQPGPEAEADCCPQPRAPIPDDRESFPRGPRLSPCVKPAIVGDWQEAPRHAEHSGMRVPAAQCAERRVRKPARPDAIPVANQESRPRSRQDCSRGRIPRRTQHSSCGSRSGFRDPPSERFPSYPPNCSLPGSLCAPSHGEPHLASSVSFLPPPRVTRRDAAPLAEIEPSGACPAAQS